MSDSKKELVRMIMEEVPETKDDDVLLYIRLAGVMGIDHNDIYTLLTKLNFASVVRTRADLQRKFDYLRGNAYDNRMKYSTVKRKEYSPNYWDRLKHYIND